MGSQALTTLLLRPQGEEPRASCLRPRKALEDRGWRCWKPLAFSPHALEVL